MWRSARLISSEYHACNESCDTCNPKFACSHLRILGAMKMLLIQLFFYTFNKTSRSYFSHSAHHEMGHHNRFCFSIRDNSDSINSTSKRTSMTGQRMSWKKFNRTWIFFPLHLIGCNVVLLVRKSRFVVKMKGRTGKTDWLRGYCCSSSEDSSSLSSESWPATTSALRAAGVFSNTPLCAHCSPQISIWKKCRFAWDKDLEKFGLNKSKGEI